MGCHWSHERRLLHIYDAHRTTNHHSTCKRRHRMATSMHTGQHVLQGGCAARRRRTSGIIMHQVSIDAAEPRRWPMREQEADQVLCCVLRGSSHACPAIGFMPFQLGQVLIAATISWRPTSSPAPSSSHVSGRRRRAPWIQETSFGYVPVVAVSIVVPKGRCVVFTA